jgi:hypothetical protein
MASLNKYLSLMPIFFVSSCSVLYPISLEIVDDIYKEPKNIYLSKSKLNIEDSTYILKSSNGSSDTLTWVSSDNNSVLVSKNGKFIKTVGLKYNFTINSKFTLKDIIPLLNPFYDTKTYILLENPLSGYLELNLRYSLLENYQDCDCPVIKESFRSDSISWSGDNYYWIDGNYRVVKSLQNFHPYSPPYKIEYLD